MKIISVEVKSNKENLGNVDVNTFESIEEAVGYFQSAAEEDAKKAGKEADKEAGEHEVLGLVNAQYKANVTNAFRVSKTRTVSPLTLLKQKIGSSPEAKQKLEAFLASIGIEGSLD